MREDCNLPVGAPLQRSRQRWIDVEPGNAVPREALAVQDQLPLSSMCKDADRRCADQSRKEHLLHCHWEVAERDEGKRVFGSFSSPPWLSR